MLHRFINRAHPRVLNFIKSYFSRGTNFDCSAIEQLLNRFDPEWYRNFKQFVEANSNVQEGISSCYSVRNSVAHGGTMSVGTKRLGEFLELSKQLIDGVIAATS